MDLAKASGISIYTITLKSEFAIRQATVTGRRYFSQAEFSMKALAQETGARSFFPTRIEELTGVYGTIADELANQYAIGYTSKNPRRDGCARATCRPGPIASPPYISPPRLSALSFVGRVFRPGADCAASEDAAYE
jgi:hypothetical protein